jgi:hypothetical protein
MSGSAGSPEAITEWVREHQTLFDSLNAALLQTTEQAGRIGRMLQSGDNATSAFKTLERNAAHFLILIHDAQEYESIPDAVTARHLAAALARWEDAAQTTTEIAESLDAPQVARIGPALDAGTDEFYRAAAALRRATGQPPDPANPKN